MVASAVLTLPAAGQALPPCPWQAVPSWPDCPLTWQLREAEQVLCWCSYLRARCFLMGLHQRLTFSSTFEGSLKLPVYQADFYLPGKCLKCRAKEICTLFKTSTGRGNNSRFYSCLAHLFGFELCSLHLTDEQLLKVMHISSQASGKVSSSKLLLFPSQPAFLSIIDNPNPF